MPTVRPRCWWCAARISATCCRCTSSCTRRCCASTAGACRLLFDAVEDLNTRPLAARLAKQILLLARSYGVEQGDETRVGLQLAQEDIAQMLGASRQRVNQELKGFEREGAVRIEPTRLVVLSKDKLLAIAAR